MSRISLQIDRSFTDNFNQKEYGKEYIGSYLYKGTNKKGTTWLSKEESTWMLGSSSNNSPTTLATIDGSKYLDFFSKDGEITATYCLENCPSVYIKAIDKTDNEPIIDGDIVSLSGGEYNLCLDDKDRGLFYGKNDPRVAYFKIKFLKDKKKMFIIAGAIIGALLLLILIYFLFIKKSIK